MKQLPIISTIVFCFVSLISLSQSTKFPTVNAKWCYAYYDETNNTNYNWEKCVEILGDTIINNTTYAFADGKNGFNYNLGIAGPYFFREENNKVFFWDKASSMEHLVYDFNLIEQDTFASSLFWNNSPTDSVTLRVEELSTIVGVDGLERKLMRLRSDNNQYGTTWIEGIGDASWVFFDPNLFDGTSLSGGYQLICFSGDQGLAYLTDGYSQLDCQLATPTSDTKFNHEITIYPNPSQGTIYISSLSSPITHVKLYNLQGKLIYSTSVNDTLLEVELANQILPGTYLLEVTDVNQARALNTLILLPH